MNSFRTLVLGVPVAALAALVSSGCQSAPAPEPTPSDPAAPAAAALKPVAPVGRSAVGAGQPTGPQQPDTSAGPPGAADSRMRELEAQMTVKEQEAEFALRAYTEAAKRDRTDNRPQRAIDGLKQALAVHGASRLSPARRDAEELLYEIETAVGVRPAAFKSIAQRMENALEVKVQEARIEAQSLVTRGKALFNAKQLPDAEEVFERVLEIVRWAPHDLDLTGHAEQAKAYLSQGKQLREQEARLRLKEKERQAKGMAVRDEGIRENEERQRVQRLFNEAVSRFEAREYDKAMGLARKILELEPGNQDAQRLLEDASDTAHSYREGEYHRNKVEQWKRVLEDFEATQVPHAGAVSWPSTRAWAKTSERVSQAGRASSGTTVADDPRVKEIRAKLATQRITLEFTDAPFATVVAHIRSHSGVNIVVEKAVMDELTTADRRVTLQVEDIPLQSALNILLDFNQLSSTFRNGVLYITKPGGAMGDAVLQLHDIRDLTQKLSHFPGEKMELKSGSGADDAGGLSFGGDGGEETVPQPEELITLIKSSVAPESWDQPGYSIAQIGGQLLVKHSREVQNEIRGLLHDLRQYSGVLISVEARFLQVTDDFLEDIGFDLRGLGGQKGTASFLDDVTVGPEDNAGGAFDNAANGNPTQPPTSGIFFNDNTDGDYRGRTEHILDNPLGNALTNTGGMNVQIANLGDTQINGILRAIQKSRRATLLTAPRLTAFNTQRSNVTVQNQIAYIRDFEVEVAQTAAIADPIVGVVHDGVILDVTPTVSNDRKYITLELRPTVATLVRPIPTIQTNLGQAASTQVNIQLPELRLQGAQTTVRVPDGGTVVIGGLKTIRDVDRQSEIPFLSHIPILSLFMGRKGRSIEKSNLILIVQARVIDLDDAEKHNYR